MAESLLDVKKLPVGDVLKGMKDESKAVSLAAGERLQRECRKYALSLRDYLTLAVQTDESSAGSAALSGYEQALVYLNLPVRDDFKAGVVLQAASETFETYPGTRALFPPVIDDMLYFTKRIDHIEQLDPMLAVSRTIAGPELLFTIVNDDGTEYQSFTIPELSRIPVRTIRTSESTVRMFKHGSGIKTSYEFNRRARLDLLTPFAARVARELELSKIAACVNILYSGDGTSGSAAVVVNQSGYDATTGVTSTAGKLNYMNILYWLVQRAKAGVPVDTVIGNFDAMFQWMALFAPVTLRGNLSPAEIVGQIAHQPFDYPSIFPANLKFAVSSAVPAGKLLGFVKGETVEELKEAGSETSEQDREVMNQSITYYRTEVTGYRLLYKDTRSGYDYTA